MSSDHDSDRAAAARLWKFSTEGSPQIALLSTADPSGRPHATWMGISRSEEADTILTITSPDSDKVKNIRANPKVEWMLSTGDRKELLYLEGEAAIVEDIAEIKRQWQSIPGKGKAFFLRYYNSGIGFSVIKTRVDSAIYMIPEEYRKTRFAIHELTS